MIRPWDSASGTRHRWEHAHWRLRDPAKASGSAEEITQVFRAVRDEIEQRIKELAKET